MSICWGVVWRVYSGRVVVLVWGCLGLWLWLCVCLIGYDIVGLEFWYFGSRFATVGNNLWFPNHPIPNTLPISIPPILKHIRAILLIQKLQLPLQLLTNLLFHNLHIITIPIRPIQYIRISITPTTTTTTTPTNIIMRRLPTPKLISIVCIFVCICIEFLTVCILYWVFMQGVVVWGGF